MRKTADGLWKLKTQAKEACVFTFFALCRIIVLYCINDVSKSISVLQKEVARRSAGRLGLSLPFAFLDVLLGFNAGVSLFQRLTRNTRL